MTDQDLIVDTLKKIQETVVANSEKSEIRFQELEKRFSASPKVEVEVETKQDKPKDEVLFSTEITKLISSSFAVALNKGIDVTYDDIVEFATESPAMLKLTVKGWENQKVAPKSQKAFGVQFQEDKGDVAELTKRESYEGMIHYIALNWGLEAEMAKVPSEFKDEQYNEYIGAEQ